VPARSGSFNVIVKDDASLDATIDSWIAELLTAAPSAIAAAKKLIFDISHRPVDSVLDVAALSIANARTSPEGQAEWTPFSLE
jgi:methylglutaconyl-CoA hydratase